MKSKFRLPHPVTLCFLLTLGVALTSWMGSVYGLGEVQSLLSPEALRWALRHGMSNYLQTPALGVVTVLFLGVGIASRAGLFEVLGRLLQREKSLSRKERRALILAGLLGWVYVLLLGAATWAPWTLFRSVTGSLVNSPFQKGFFFLLSLGIGLMGMGFGFASGRFCNDRDVIRGLSCLFVRFGDYFVLLFFLAQLFASLQYTRLLECFGMSSVLVGYLFDCCCYLPFLFLFREKSLPQM